MILADDNFATIVVAVRLGRSVWNNLRKILLFNTPVNNSQGLTVLCGIIGGLENSPLTPIQVLYCNLICAVTLGMVLAIEPAEAGIMTEPPRRPGKKLIGRFLLLRIAIGTVVLTGTSIGAVFWLYSGYNTITLESINEICASCRCVACPNITGSIATTVNQVKDACASMPDRCSYNLADYTPYNWNHLRSQASNTLTFGAISIMFSARFSYESSLPPRIFRGNIWAWYSAAITAVLQIMITYIPGLNNIVFQMEGMDGVQWGIVFLMMTIVFIVMETEKLVRRRLKKDGVDTDDLKTDPLFDDVEVSPESVADPFVPARIHSSGTLHSTLLKR